MKIWTSKKHFIRVTFLLPVYLFLILLHSCLSYAGGLEFSLIVPDSPAFGSLSDRVSGYFENVGNLGYLPPVYKMTGNSEAIVLGIASHHEAFLEVMAILPSEHDVNELVRYNIMGDGWMSQFPYAGTPFTSTVVFMSSDPDLEIEDWDDLLAEDVSIVMADPRRCSESRWIVLAAYKWAEIQFDGDMEQIEAFLRELFSKVRIVAYSSGDAADTFESNQEDVNVILLWESDALMIQDEAGGNKRIVYPSVTVRTEPKVAYHDDPQCGNLAERCVPELFGPALQETAAECNFRPSNEEILQKYSDKFYAGMQQYSISDFGGWAEAFEKFFAEGALFDQLGFPLVGGMTMRENAAEFGKARTGDIVYFGECEQDMVISDGFEPIEWEVLDASGDRALLLSTKNLDGRFFDDWEDYWNGSQLRDWLQNTFFYSAFTEEDQRHIFVKHNLAETSPGGATSGETDDVVGILSISEAEQYKVGPAGNTAYANIMSERGLSYSIYESCYTDENPSSLSWLRTPGDLLSGDGYGFAQESYMESSGAIQSQGTFLNIPCGVRPIIWVENEIPVSVRNEPEDPETEESESQMETEEEDPYEMVRLANAYRFGREVEQDAEKALRLYEKAAEAGNGGAMWSLGDWYEIGSFGIEKDYKKAKDWYEKAVEAGVPAAMTDLGRMYELGEGVETDYALALEWYEKGVEAGDPDGLCRLGYMYEAGEGVDQDYKKAVEYYKKAVEAGSSFGMEYLGTCYLYGNGVTADSKEALRWYISALDSGLSWIDERNRNIAVQEVLNYLGYDCGEANGEYNEKTRDAVQSFRKDHGIDESDQIDLELMKKILGAAGN